MALQFLDLAYSHYREIIRNLDEGLKVSYYRNNLDIEFDCITVLQ